MVLEHGQAIGLSNQGGGCDKADPRQARSPIAQGPTQALSPWLQLPSLEQTLAGDPAQVERSFARLYDKYQARIFNALGQDITTALGDSLVNLTSYDNAKKTFKYKFDSHALIEHYFNETTGVFRKNGGDRAVVVLPVTVEFFVAQPGLLGDTVDDLDHRPASRALVSLIEDESG